MYACNPVRTACYLVNETRDRQEGRLYSKWKGYGQSKTANCLMTVALADKLGKKGLTAISLHPGVIGTNLGNHIDWSKDYAEMRT